MQAWPPDFLDNMRLMLADDFPQFIEGLSSAAPVSVRLNPFKAGGKFYNEKKVSWCDDGRYLERRPSFTLDPLFHAGCYYVQEASSMFLESVFKQYFSADRAVRAIDLCAAPGGKSTHLLSLLPEGSVLVSNEIIPNRNKVLRQNICKWGRPDVIVTQNEVKDFISLAGYFDLVVVDAPCSGEGLFRRDPVSANEWSTDVVRNCVIRQNGILDDAFRLLKPGGILIYSTCTFETCENEEQIERLISLHNAELLDLNDRHKGIINSGQGLRFYPVYVDGEGFFISAVRKSDGREQELKKTKRQQSSWGQKEFLLNYLEHPELFSPFEKNNILFAIPAEMIDLFYFMEKRFYIRQTGIRLGEIKGEKPVPEHDIALSTSLRKGLPAVELSKQDAIRYLRCENVECRGAEKGWNLAQYGSFPLGWIKVLDNRVNNYFPKEWRIRMDYNPNAK